MKSAVVVRLCLPFNWSITTASLPWSTENSKTAVTGVFSCPVNVERNVEDGCWVTVSNEKQNTRGHLQVVAPDWRRAFNLSLLTFLTVLRSCRWRTGGGRPPRTSDTRSVSSAVVFMWRRTKLSRNVSPFLNEFLVYLGVKKLHGTHDSSFLEWRLDTFVFCRWSFSPAAWNLRIVFGTRDCNDVLHTLGGSYYRKRGSVSYYRKRGSVSYIVREWLLWVVERERETPVTSIDITLKSRVIMHMITSTARRERVDA